MAALAERWRDRYPDVQEHPPLPPNPPLGSGLPVGSALTVNVGAPQIRLWLLNGSGDRLVQLQRDRMVVNWRLANGTGPYPRYRDALRPEFERNLTELLAYLADRELPAPRLVGTEVTYVNLVRDARLDLVGILRSQIVATAPNDSPSSTRIQQVWTRTSGDDSGFSTLTLTAEPADSDQVLLTVTGRSVVTAPGELADVLGALDNCHHDVVTSFVNLTDEKRHRQWGRLS